jgi:hypothetical protein
LQNSRQPLDPHPQFGIERKFNASVSLQEIFDAQDRPR